MAIRIQLTPNPNAHKYILPALCFPEPLNCASPEEAKRHSLAAKLFALKSVYNVFLAQDFVTVNKAVDGDWARLDEQVVRILEDFCVVQGVGMGQRHG